MLPKCRAGVTVAVSNVTALNVIQLSKLSVIAKRASRSVSNTGGRTYWRQRNRACLRYTSIREDETRVEISCGSSSSP